MLTLVAAIGLGAVGALSAQSPSVHYQHHGAMPPGAIGSQQLRRGGPLPGFFQPVEIKAPHGALISLAHSEQFDDGEAGSRRAGLLIGSVYRLRIANIRLAEGQEVFPTIELIDRLYAPVDQQCRFAIPIDITEEDLRLALDGKFVTRVVYLEDPRRALPSRDDPQSQSWFEAAPGQDPLAVADGLGRPVAILRLGARVPTAEEAASPEFCYGSPPFVNLPPPTAAPQPAAAPMPCSTKPRPAVAPASPKAKNLPPPPEV